MEKRQIPKASKKKQQKTPQQFLKAYENLCKEYGYGIQVVPEYQYLNDLKMWGTIQKTIVVKV